MTNRSDPFARDIAGRTSLFYAAEEGGINEVRRIIYGLTGTGFSPQRLSLLVIKDVTGLTASDVAEQAGHAGNRQPPAQRTGADGVV